MAQKSNARIDIFSWILLSGAIILPFSLEKSAIDSGLHPRQIVLALWVAAMSVYALIRQPKGKLNLQPFLIAAFIWFIWQLVPHFGALSKGDSLSLLLRNGSLVGLLLVLTAALQWKWISHIDLIRAGFIFALIVAIHTAISIAKALGEGAFQESVYSVSGLFQHKNLLSGALLIALPFALLGSCVLKSWMKPTAAVVAGLLFLEIFLLRTRGAWLGILVAAFTTGGLAMLTGGELKKSLGFLRKIWPVIPVIIIALAFSLNSEISQSSLLNERNITHRFAFWNNTMDMVAENAFTGVGNGNWRVHFSKYGLEHTDANVMNGQTGIQRPHNDYLWILAEQGVPGLLAFLALILLAKWRHFSERKKVKDRSSALVHLALWFGFIGFAIFSLGDFPYERSAHMAFYMILLLLMLSPSSEAGGRKIPAAPLLIAFTAISLFSAYVASQRMQSEVAVKQVQRFNSQQSPQIIRAAERAENAYYVIDNFTNPLPYYSGLGRLYLEKNLPAAQKDLERALEIHPWHILSLNQLGNLHKQRGQYQKAEALFDEALAISPEFEMARLNKAEMLIKKEEWDQAFLFIHGCPLKSKNRKLFVLAAQILPQWLENRLNGKGEARSELVNVLLPYRNKPEDMVRVYAQYRQQKLRANQRALGTGKTN